MASPVYMPVDEKAAAVQSALSGGKVFEAMAAALNDAPTKSKDDAYKAAVADVVFGAFDAVKSSDIDGVVSRMDLEQCSVAMRYVYRAMKEKRSCPAMLKWHAALVKHAGQGCIVRAISSRRTV